ncbi:hypothetical protein F4777DRAFT_552041 [Nemania sp. FL0916]|nr:hypothetical protein F4777DRAFT_552041 [Nemania sp. FL0916]
MCTWHMSQYTCGCVKPMIFEQCSAAKASERNIKCRPIEKVVRQRQDNYCHSHLVYGDAKKMYASNRVQEMQ